MNAITLKNVTKRYDKFTLENISLEIPKGYITGLIGRNGAGKTTLIKTILAFTDLDGGEISVLGKNMAENEKELKNKIGIVIGDGAFYQGYRLKRMTKVISGFYDNWDQNAYNKYIARFGLDESKKIKELSTGMRAKYNIALALSHNAELIVMDEPSSGLDPLAREELMDIFAEMIEEREITVLISTHITSDLDRTADYIVMINDGKILFNTPKDELLEAHRIVKGGKDELTSEVKAALVEYKTGAYGFEGLTADGVNMKKKFPSLVYEKPMAEDIMRYYARG